MAEWKCFLSFLAGSIVQRVETQLASLQQHHFGCGFKMDDSWWSSCTRMWDVSALALTSDGTSVSEALSRGEGSAR